MALWPEKATSSSDHGSLPPVWRCSLKLSSVHLGAGHPGRLAMGSEVIVRARGAVDLCSRERALHRSMMVLEGALLLTRKEAGSCTALWTLLGQGQCRPRWIRREGHGAQEPAQRKHSCPNIWIAEFTLGVSQVEFNWQQWLSVFA